MKNKTPKTPTLRPQKTKKLQIGVLRASLEHYNNKDVEFMIPALNFLINFWNKFGIDMLQQLSLSKCADLCKYRFNIKISQLMEHMNSNVNPYISYHIMTGRNVHINIVNKIKIRVAMFQIMYLHWIIKLLDKCLKKVHVTFGVNILQLVLIHHIIQHLIG